MNNFIYQVSNGGLTEQGIEKGDSVRIEAKAYSDGDIVAIAGKNDISVLDFKRYEDTRPDDLLIGKVTTVYKAAVVAQKLKSDPLVSDLATTLSDLLDMPLSAVYNALQQSITQVEGKSAAIELTTVERLLGMRSGVFADSISYAAATAPQS